jgi:hypothetical protein
MSNTPQGGAIEGNAADDALMVDQGHSRILIEMQKSDRKQYPAFAIRSL